MIVNHIFNLNANFKFFSNLGHANTKFIKSIFNNSKNIILILIFLNFFNSTLNLKIKNTSYRNELNLFLYFGFICYKE